MSLQSTADSLAEVAKHLKSLAAVAKELDRKAGVVAAEGGGLKAQGRQTAVQLGRVMPLVEERDRRETTRLSGFSWVHDK